jgi:hypothetical protein
MNGSYFCKLYPNLCSAAFVLECSKGCSCVVGSFFEALLVANAFRGELLGLMAIHQIDLFEYQQTTLQHLWGSGNCIRLS